MNNYAFDSPMTGIGQLMQDPVAVTAIMHARKGDDKKIGHALFLPCMLLMIFLAAAVIYLQVTPDKADFYTAKDIFYQRLLEDTAPEKVQVLHLDAYYHNNSYYYDVTYSVDGQEDGSLIRRVYNVWSIRSMLVNVFDPEQIITTDAERHAMWFAAQKEGEYKSYLPEQVRADLNELLAK